MGLEARCTGRWSGGEGEVSVRLEAHELIVSGALRRRFALAGLTDVAVAGEDLAFTAAGERFALTLGASVARRWAVRIATPPPTLAARLGLAATVRLHLFGSVDDAALAEAVAVATISAAAEAEMTIARIDDAAGLEAALDAHADVRAPNAPIWLVYGKGPKSPFGESAIRGPMRAGGFVDTKVAAVSDRLTAARWQRRAPPVGGDQR